MPFENYNNLEQRIHIAGSLSALEALRVEGEQYFVLGDLSLDTYLGYFYNQRWQKEILKREIFFPMVDYTGYSIVYNGEDVVFNGDSVTYNE